MRSSAICWILLLALGAAPAWAQEEQVSLKLNYPVLASQYLSVPDKTDLEGMSGITIEAWVYPTSTTDFQTIVGNDYRHSYWLGLVPSGNPTYPLKVRFYPTGGVGNYVEALPVDLQPNRWSHIAVTYSVPTNVWTCRVNAATVASGIGLPIPGPIGSSSGDLRIGADREGASASYFFRGYLDEVRIWSTAASSAVLGNVWMAGASHAGCMTSEYFGLRAWWTMWGPSSSFGPLTFRDDRQYGGVDTDNYAIAMNGASPSTLAPPVDYNVAVHLGGTTDYAHSEVSHTFSNGITLEAWIAPYDVSNFPTIVGRDFNTSFWLGLTASGHLRFYPTGGGGNFVESIGTIGTSHWTHVAATYRNGWTRLYIDGELDAVYNTISGPVGENGRVIYVGADNGVGGPGYFYNGLLDEVRVTEGERSRYQIRQEMFIGHDRIPLATRLVPDVLGINRNQEIFAFGRTHSRVFTFGNARLVRSGAPLASPYGADGAEVVERSTVMDYMLDGFRTQVWSSLAPGGLPAGTATMLSLTDNFAVPETIPITDIDVFVSLPTTALAGTGVYLHHPNGTIVTLLAPSTSAGRGLHTVFDDEAAPTLASGVAPYVDGVRPSSPLSALDGKLTNGTWTLEVTSPSSSGPDIGLWTWGIKFNGIALAVEGQLPAEQCWLRNIGANPARASGRLEFSLSRAANASVKAYDLRGRCVAILSRGWHAAGRHLVDWDARGLADGIYFARLDVEGHRVPSVKVAVVR